MRVLIVTSTRIGDAILSAGVLARVHQLYPEARITIACGPAVAPLFAAVPNLERVIPLAKRRFSLHWLDLWLSGMRHFWGLVVDLRGSALAYLLPTRRRWVVGRARPGMHRVRHLAVALGLDEPPAPHIWTTRKHERSAASMIAKDRPVLALAPTANWRGKVWPAANYIELLSRLVGPKGILPGARVAVFSAPEEREAALAVLKEVPAARRIDVAGRTDLITAYACLKRCAFFVGNDSALMHMAAAAGIPTLGLFGPSREAHYAPWGPHTGTVRTARPYEDLVGQTGYDHRTTDSLMGSLSVDAVEAAAREMWRGRARPGRVGRPTLSALVVARDEAAQLDDCLKTLSFADEIVVVLDRTTDGSAKIARGRKARIVEGAWDIEGERRNAGISACSSDWILEVDADERVPRALAREIRRALPGSAPGYFLVPFDNYIGERLVKYGWGASWGVNSTARLFSRGAKIWGGQRVHPATELTGARGRLKSPMTHYVDRDISDILRRLDRYTALRAEDLRASDKKESLGRNLRRFFSRFYKCYVRRKGYREGAMGVLIALMAGLYPLLSWLRARLEEE